MARDFRQRAVNTANVLIDAANMLENQGSGTSGRIAQGNSATNQSNPGTPSSHSTLLTSRSVPSSSGASPSLELRSLFNWKRKSKVALVVVDHPRSLKFVLGRTRGFV